MTRSRCDEGRKNTCETYEGDLNTQTVCTTHAPIALGPESSRTDLPASTCSPARVLDAPRIISRSRSSPSPTTPRSGCASRSGRGAILAFWTMSDEEYALLVAIGSWLEYRSGPDGARGFVREPVYNVSVCFSEYLESLPESREKSILQHNFTESCKEVRDRLRQHYQP